MEYLSVSCAVNVLGRQVPCGIGEELQLIPGNATDLPTPSPRIRTWAYSIGYHMILC